jgi:hypothetical protein
MPLCHEIIQSMFLWKVVFIRISALDIQWCNLENEFSITEHAMFGTSYTWQQGYI